MTEFKVQPLLVEDNVGDARLIEELLAESQIRNLHVATTCAEAEAALASTFDVVLLDLSLPDSQGLSTLHRIRTIAPNVPVVVLTGWGDDEIAVLAVKAGAQDYLVKGTFEGRSLLRSIRYAIERNRAEQAERERHALEDALVAINHLIAVLGHELRTPLTSLRLLSEYMLTDQTTTVTHWEQHIRSMNSEVVRMTDFVNDMLEAARLDSGISHWNWSIVQANAVGQEALTLLEPLTEGRSMQLAFSCHPEDLCFNGDPNAVRRLIVNLGSNAIRHTRTGTVDFRIQRLVHDEQSFVVLSVRDTGLGIAPEALDKLGVAFATNTGTTTSRASGGTGLGLAICKGIAAVHGGSISVASAIGQGTTFTVTLRADLHEPSTMPEELKIIREAAA